MKFNQNLLFLFFLFLTSSISAQRKEVFDGVPIEVYKKLEVNQDNYYTLNTSGKTPLVFIFRADSKFVIFKTDDLVFEDYYYKMYEAKDLTTGNKFYYIETFDYDDYKMQDISATFILGNRDNEILLFQNFSTSLSLRESNFDEVFEIFGTINLHIIRSEPKRFEKNSSGGILRDLLIGSDNFYTREGDSYQFNEDNSFSKRNAMNGELSKGVFEVASVTLNKRDIGVDENGEASFTVVKFYVKKEKRIWLLSTSDGKVADGYLHLYFYDLDIGFNTEPIEFKRKISASISWSEITSQSKFLSSIDFLYRGWISFIIEEALEKPNQDEALKFVLDSILDFPDAERKKYGEIMKEIIMEKYWQKN